MQEKKRHLTSLSLKKYTLHFKNPIKTSRGSMKEKESWFLIYQPNPEEIYLGECGYLKGLSIDQPLKYQEKINQLNQLNFLEEIEASRKILEDQPALLCGYEMLLNDYKDYKDYFNNRSKKLKKEIIINGLIWMGDMEYGKSQIDSLVERKFSCLKMKVGINAEQEIKLLQYMREKNPQVIIRLDANGAFSIENLFEKLSPFNPFKIHSIEQPLPPAKPDWSLKEKINYYQKVCSLLKEIRGKNLTIKIALDEELIGLKGEEKRILLDHYQPDYLVLKPSLLGGFRNCQDWIKLAEERKIGWWTTSALESNLGLSAIADWTYSMMESSKENLLTQGLGTGSLYENNFFPPYVLDGERLILDGNKYPLLKEDVKNQLVN